MRCMPLPTRHNTLTFTDAEAALLVSCLRQTIRDHPESQADVQPLIETIWRTSHIFMLDLDALALAD